MAVKGSDNKMSTGVAAENVGQPAKLHPHPQRTYSLVDWVCGNMLAPVSCIRDGRGQGQGQTYADSAATTDAPTTTTTSQQPIQSSPRPLEPLEKSVERNGATKQNADQWNWIGMKAALKVRSSDLNMFAPQSM